MKTDDSMLDLDNQLCFALHSTLLAVNKVYRKILKPFNITYSQYLVLLVLWKQDGLTVSALGEPLYLDSATLTPLLKRMEALELVFRQRSIEDERQVLIHLTDKGKRLKNKARSIPEKALCSTGCEQESLSELKSSLEKLRGNILGNLNKA